MSASSFRCSAAVLLAAWLGPGTARAQAQAQSELGWWLQSGDVLGEPGVLRRGPVWDGLAGRLDGRENLLRVRWMRDDAGAIRPLATRAQLRFELAPGFGDGEAPRLRDLSSFIGVGIDVGRAARFELRAFPFDTDYLRLGWLHALDWGGTDGARRESVFLQPSGAAPGVELAWRMPRLQLFAGLKWASASTPLHGAERLWGVAFGGSVELWRELRCEAGFGYYQRPRLGDARGFVEGGSWRAVWRRGPSEPELSPEPLRPAPLRSEAGSFAQLSERGAAVALEVVSLVLRQRRFEDARAQRLTAAPAAALSASFRGPVVALHAAVSWRSLAFVVRDDARVAADQTLPAQAQELPELAAWLGGSITAPRGWVAAVELGLELPAALVTSSPLPGYPQTFVAGGPTGLEALPLGAGRLPVAAGRGSLRAALSASVSVAGWVDYVRDANATVLGGASTSSLGVVRRFASPDGLGLGLGLQARF